MNDKERFYRVTHFMDADRAPNTEIGFASLAVDGGITKGFHATSFLLWRIAGFPRRRDR